MGEDEGVIEELEDKFGLEVFHMGCVVLSPFRCYNSQVEQELKLFESTDLNR
jgi:hypothetical protein